METDKRVKNIALDLEIHPVTPERWRDLEMLFKGGAIPGDSLAGGGCWCMEWRLRPSQWAKQLGEANRKAMKRIVASGEIPGLLAYVNGEPVGWCSVAPRDRFARLERSRKLKRVDDQPVWSVVCFFVAEPFRGQGLMVKLLRAAIDYTRDLGSMIVEGYPVEPLIAKLSGASGFTGIVSAFREAGFVEVARRSARQPIMRYYIRGEPGE